MPRFLKFFRPVPLIRQPMYQPAQLMWPFDPESITIPLWAREKYVWIWTIDRNSGAVCFSFVQRISPWWFFRYRLTQYCPARNDVDIGAGQRVGLLTKWVGEGRVCVSQLWSSKGVCAENVSCSLHCYETVEVDSTSKARWLPMVEEQGGMKCSEWILQERLIVREEDQELENLLLFNFFIFSALTYAPRNCAPRSQGLIGDCRLNECCREWYSERH